MARDFFIRPDLLALGVPDRTIRVLEKAANLVDIIETQAAQTDQLTAIDGAVDALEEAAEDAALSLTSLDARIDAFEVLGPLVEQDVGAAWSAATGTEARTALASYAGQVISNPPTQVEVQALDDAVKAISQHLVAFINDAKANGVLT